MKNLNIAKKVLLAVAVTGLALSTGAFGSSSSSIGVQAEVPLICNVSLSGGNSNFNASGVADLGSTSEFCNGGKGYKVFARAEGDVDGASIIVDGRAFPLQSGAEFVVVSSNQPASTSRAIQFDAGDTDGGGRLSLRIVAN
jgi:hypothetical protein